MIKPEFKFSTISTEDIPGNSSGMMSSDLVVSGQKQNEIPNRFLFFHPYIINGFAFLLCVEGEGEVSINLKEYTLTRNVLVCVLPGFIFEVKKISEDFHLEYIFFSLDFFTELRMFLRVELPIAIEENPSIQLDEEKKTLLMEYHSLISSRNSKPDQPYQAKIIRNLIRALLYEITTLHSSRNQESRAGHSRNEEITFLFGQCLYKNYLKERSVEFYASKLYITPKHLAKVIKATLGKNPLQLINEMVILHSKALLKSTNMTIAQISQELEFSSSSFFGRFFKKHTGMTPAAYRATP
ncbi:MAG: AraC family transcriptional regulator [Dysgonamonadaceae bacterium]